MKLHLKEIDTSQGRVIQIPVEEWERYSRQYEQMKVRLYWKKRLQSSINQVKKMEVSGLDSITVNDFLNEF